MFDWVLNETLYWWSSKDLASMGLCDCWVENEVVPKTPVNIFAGMLYNVS